MNQSLVDQLTPAQVIEVAIMVFGDMLGTEDPEDIPARVSALTNGAVNDETADALIARAGNEAEDDVVRVLRMLLANELDGPDGERVRQALSQAGVKLLALSPELMYIGSALIALLVIVPIKKETRRSIRMTTGKDGREIVSIDENTIYVNPTSTLVALIKKMFVAG